MPVVKEKEQGKSEKKSRKPINDEEGQAKTKDDSSTKSSIAEPLTQQSKNKEKTEKKEKEQSEQEDKEQEGKEKEEEEEGVEEAGEEKEEEKEEEEEEEEQEQEQRQRQQHKAAPAEPINNVQWVADNAKFLHPKDPNKTYEYVIRHHPLFGSSRRLTLPKKLTGDETPEFLATLADAVCVACIESLGEREPACNTIVAVGNMAYISLHHSKEEIKKKYGTRLNEWKREKLKNRRKRQFTIFAVVLAIIMWLYAHFNNGV